MKCLLLVRLLNSALVTACIVGLQACGIDRAADTSSNKPDEESKAEDESDSDPDSSKTAGTSDSASQEDSTSNKTDDQISTSNNQFNAAFLTEFHSLPADKEFIGTTAEQVDQGTFDSSVGQPCAGKIGDFMYIVGTNDVLICLPLHPAIASVGLSSLSAGAFVTLNAANWKRIYIGEVDYTPQYLASYITKDAEATAWEISYVYGDISSTGQSLTIYYQSLPKRNEGQNYDMYSSWVSQDLLSTEPQIKAVESTNDTFGVVTSASFGMYEITSTSGSLPTMKITNESGDHALTSIDIR